MISSVPNSLNTNLKVIECRIEMVKALDGQNISPLRERYYLETYPALSVCTNAEDGEPLPSIDQLLDADIYEANNWYEAVQEINSFLLPSSDEPVSEVVEEKKKKKRTRHKRVIQSAPKGSVGVG